MTGEVSDARRRLTSRTAALAGAGERAVRALGRASVLVVGAGGLGAPVLTYLAGSGLGRVTIVDHDVVDASNLARQTLFATADIGRSKAECAADRVRGVDPELEVVALTESFRPEHVAGHDVVVDAADSVAVTRAISDACAAAGVPFVWGTVLGLDGQVSVFHDGHSEPIDFHDLHPDALPDEGSCALDGVLPALCGAIGSVMAAQVTALVAGIGEPLLGRVLTVDARRWRWTESVLRRGPGSRRPDPLVEDAPPVIAPAALAAELARRAERAELAAQPAPGDRLLVDVRTPVELATGVIPGSIRPDDLDPVADATTAVVVICASGVRATAWARTARAAGRSATVLDGGIEAWRREGHPMASISADADTIAG
ncbi:adenylyltransferase and sulfurtransferase [Curtobacterium sp. UNCCL20]|uniref:ThiF family adenylyltransferase n=1 Tax=Curtobacterium sp. UNCCL20 TaxID=1502773 RepID=UPI000887F5D1|nr:ThiF family adenylyltransferase [Curtobacterium sp. UNCCL20]SDQ61737.1 adenylyltransferase and sulfurtransferase [Curtobacterium sp. UNCCL20]